MPPRTQKTSISLKPDLVEWAEARAHELGFENSFSAYIAWLIARDRRELGAAGELHETAAPYGKKTADTKFLRKKKQPA